MSKTLERAFPVTDRNAGPASGGMTLRDYFAAAAMQGMISTCKKEASASLVANGAYRFADAMLAARERKEDGR